MRIDDRDGGRECSQRQVVIRHDDVEADLVGVRHLGEVHDPAVDGDDEVDARRAEPIQPGTGKPVPLRQPGGDVARRLDAERPEREDPDRDGAHPVGVVVAPDRDPLAGGDGGVDPVERAVRIGHAREVVEGAGTRFEERHELRVVAEAAPSQESRHRASESGEFGGLREGLGQEPVEARRDHPAMVVGRDGAPLSAALSVARGLSARAGGPKRGRPTSGAGPTRTRRRGSGSR